MTEISDVAIQKYFQSLLFTSDNEFQLDPTSNGLHGEHNMCSQYHDIFDILNTVQSSELVGVLGTDEIIMDSLIKVYSSSIQSYIDIAALLTKNSLYFMSAVNYQIWQEFRTRTKIDKLIYEQKQTEHVQIYDALADNLLTNMDLIDDENIIKLRIKPHLIGKTKKEIKLQILSNNDNIGSLWSFFESFASLKSVNLKLNSILFVMIDEFFNTDIIKETQRSDFMEYLFDDIAWTDENRKHNSNIITLQKYHNESSIVLLNNRKRQYFAQKRLSNEAQIITISEYHGNKIKFTHNKICMVSLKKYCAVEPFGEYVFNLNDKTKKNGIACLLSSRNLRYEWITHLDYVINKCNNTDHDTSDDKKQSNHSTSQNKAKLMNDFTNKCEKDENKDEFSSQFSFGMYLNYWEVGYENSVVPLYKTLKDELLTNKIATISVKDYYWLYEKCKMLQQRAVVVKAQNIGINNKKFNILKGEPITINHLISLKLYTDFGNIQNELKKHC
eukprot:148604_1